VVESIASTSVLALPKKALNRPLESMTSSKYAA
jgi:hypothetical protein